MHGTVVLTGVGLAVDLTWTLMIRWSCFSSFVNFSETWARKPSLISQCLPVTTISM